MFDLDTLLHGFGTKTPSKRIEIHDKSEGSYLSVDANEMIDIFQFGANLAVNINNYMRSEMIKNKIKAIEMMEEETDPKIKRRMQIYIEEGNYDFSDIRNF